MDRMVYQFNHGLGFCHEIRPSIQRLWIVHQLLIITIITPKAGNYFLGVATLKNWGGGSGWELYPKIPHSTLRFRIKNKGKTTQPKGRLPLSPWAPSLSLQSRPLHVPRAARESDASLANLRRQRCFRWMPENSKATKTTWPRLFSNKSFINKKLSAKWAIIQGADFYALELLQWYYLIRYEDGNHVGRHS